MRPSQVQLSQISDTALVEDYHGIVSRIDAEMRGSVAGSWGKDDLAKVRTIYLVMNNISRQMMASAYKSFLYKKFGYELPKTHIDNWLIDGDNLAEVFEDYKIGSLNSRVVSDAYEDTEYIYDALNKALLVALEETSASYDELMNDHEYHDDFVEGCEDCESEHIDDRRELAGMHRDYETM